MAVEVDHYIKSRHNCNWNNIGLVVLNSKSDGGLGFFHPAKIEVSQNEDESGAVIFGSNVDRVKIRYKSDEGLYITGPLEFPVVLEPGEVVEIYSHNKSVDLKLLPVPADRQQ